MSDHPDGRIQVEELAWDKVYSVISISQVSLSLALNASSWPIPRSCYLMNIQWERRKSLALFIAKYVHCAECIPECIFAKVFIVSTYLQ